MYIIVNTEHGGKHAPNSAAFCSVKVSGTSFWVPDSWASVYSVTVTVSRCQCHPYKSSPTGYNYSYFLRRHILASN